MRGVRSSSSPLAALILLFLLSPLGASAATGTPSRGSSYPNTSWALGVVVPQGAGTSGGGAVRWETVTNVTALVSLPNITLPDRVVYAILSVMASDGSVMQGAAGIYPNSSIWLAYGWFVPGVNQEQLSYTWILNGSGPYMPAGSILSLSIFLSSGTWNLKVVDESTGSSTARPFPGRGIALKMGDQEVFALESYSRAGTTFQRMGNLTLEGVLLDGRRVVSGFYPYSFWDPNHSPLFAVGSAGTSPPSFVSFDALGGGSFAWSYISVWNGDGSLKESLSIVVVGVIAALVSVAGASICLARRAPKPHGA